MRKPAAYIPPEAMAVGLEAQFEREISEADVLAFADSSRDWNPLHVDPGYAESTNYGRPIVHGAFQVAMASEMLGMHVPGERALLSSVTARFVAPLYYPCDVRVKGRVVSWDATSKVGNLHVVVLTNKGERPTAEINLGFTLHHRPGRQSDDTLPADETLDNTVTVPPGNLKTVLVTGAGGEIGSAIAHALSEDYLVICQGRDAARLRAICDSPRLIPLVTDFDEVFADKLDHVLQGSPLYGIVHAAWPGAPKGGLLGTAPEVLTHQLEFGSKHTIALARYLFARVATETGGRLVVLGSTYGHKEPVLNLAAYSLGKGLVEDTVRLLAPELARKKISANVLNPSFVYGGMNKHVPEAYRLKVQAGVPLGRLCELADVAAQVRFLLASDAAFISGQVIHLTGGKL
jgi:NAD(P)-dependent dehydrogenase (short-subunit alcohol dehydrogenase family)/acyl dehydratase